MKILSLLFSGEFFFSAFLLAGYFKQGINTPVDITIIFLFLSLIVAVKRFLRSPTFLKNTFKATLLFLSLLAVITISFFYTDSAIYAKDKLIRFCVITAWSFFGVFYLLKSQESLKRFFKGIALITSIITVIALIELFNSIRNGSYNGTIFILNTDYLALGRSVGLGLITLICFKWYDVEKPSKIVSLIIIIMFIVVLFGGGKMPLIATIISLFVVILLSTKLTNKNTKNGLTLTVNKGTKRLFNNLVLFTLCFIPLYSTGLVGKIFRRLSSMFQGNDESTLAREYLYGIALQMMHNNFFLGAGWGTFSLYYNGMDEKIYPHNIFLEIGAENGVFALLIFIILILFSIKSGYITYKNIHKKLNAYQYTIIASAVFFFFNANTSGDITDNKILFTYSAILCISPYITKLVTGEQLEKIIDTKKSNVLKARKL